MNVNDFGPFNFDVWGTVSEWVYVFVTAITGYLIWRTLRSQQKVQKLQQTLAEIESHRFRESNKPKFGLKIKSNTQFLQNPGKIKLEASFTISALNHVAFDVAIVIQPVGDFDFQPNEGYPKLYKKIIPGMSPTLKGIVNSSILDKEDENKYLLNFDVVLEYQDLYKNHYKQIIRCAINEGDGLVLPAEAFFIS